MKISKQHGKKCRQHQTQRNPPQGLPNSRTADRGGFFKDGSMERNEAASRRKTKGDQRSASTNTIPHNEYTFTVPDRCEQKCTRSQY